MDKKGIILNITGKSKPIIENGGTFKGTVDTLFEGPEELPITGSPIVVLPDFQTHCRFLKGAKLHMEWNFLFRVDHLKQTGEEKNLKGLLFTEDKNPPSVDAIQSFLKNCGYNVNVKDADHLVFGDDNVAEPVEIRIVRLGNEEESQSDAALRYLAEQFRRPDPQIGG